MAQRNIRLLRITWQKFVSADRLELRFHGVISTPFRREISTKKFSPLKQEQYLGEESGIFLISAIKKLANVRNVWHFLRARPRRNLFFLCQMKKHRVSRYSSPYYLPRNILERYIFKLSSLLLVFLGTIVSMKYRLSS